MLDTIETPALILDEHRLNANIKKMRKILNTAGVEFRPHLKTCKSLDIANRILPPTEGSKITVSTLAEAECFLKGGYRDILYAVSIAPNKLKRVKALQEAGANMTLLLDTLVAAKQISEAGQEMGTTFPCFIEIDCDGKRAGLKPNDITVLEIAKHLDEATGVSLSGVMTHSGGSYYCKSTDEIYEVAEQERLAITQAATVIRKQGIECTIVSAGSTPTATYTRSTNGITEIRAGVYVFQDMVMQALGVCQTDDIAISVLSTVISHNSAHNRLLIDAGSLALSADPGLKNEKGQTHFGQVCEIENAKILEGLFVGSTNQEHGLISLAGTNYSLDDFPIGSQLRILPNHACITAAAYPGYHVISLETGDISAYWPRHNGW